MSSVNIKLSKGDTSLWGFRLQGGKDFGQPLVIQKVNGGSVAEKGGLQAGDALVKVNNTEVYDLTHKDAQDTLTKAGNNLDLTVQRGGGGIWKPNVSMVGNMPAPGSATSGVTKTSLAYKGPAATVPSGHNVSPRPFANSPQMNGGDTVKAIVNKQYNTPVNIYSEESIAETLSAQAEVLAGGVLGVNFKKNERTYDSQKSEVFKMVQEVEKEPRSPEPVEPTSSLKSGLRHVEPPQPQIPTTPTQLPPGQNICADWRPSSTTFYSTASHAVGGRATSPRPVTPIAQQMGSSPSLPQDGGIHPPQDKPYIPAAGQAPNPQCSECGKAVVGVFVRIKDKNLHVECFKCSTCGASLKNVGYYNINNKLYCDIHAKLAARSNAPAPNLEPVTIPPGGKIPTGAVSAPVFTPTKPGSPSTMAPMPFHSPRIGTSHVSAPSWPKQPASTGPKPFASSTFAPQTPPASVPFTPSSFKPQPPTACGTTVVWPPSSQTTCSMATIASQQDRLDVCKKMSICSEEVSNICKKSGNICCQIEGRPCSPVPFKIKETTRNITKLDKEVAKSSINQAYEKSVRRFTPTQDVCEEKLISQSNVHGRASAEILDISTKPHSVRSLLPDASDIRPLSPLQVIVYPPRIPDKLPIPKSRSGTPADKFNIQLLHEIAEDKKFHKQEKLEEKHQKIVKEEKLKETHKKIIKEEKIENLNVEQPKKERSKSPKERKSKKKGEQLFTKSDVEKIVKEEIQKLLIEEMLTKEEKITKQITINDLPKPVMPAGPMAKALATASKRPFSPSIINTETAIKPTGPISLPPDTEPYFPPPHPPEKETERDNTARALREVGCPSPMTDALTVASDRPYSPLPDATRPLTPVTNTVSVAGFRPIAYEPIPPPRTHKKHMTLLNALTVAPEVPFTVPGKTPIPMRDSPKTISEGNGAFKPVSPTSSSAKVIKSDSSTTSKSHVAEEKWRYFPAYTYVPLPTKPGDEIKTGVIEGQPIDNQEKKETKHLLNDTKSSIELDQISLKEMTYQTSKTTCQSLEENKVESHRQKSTTTTISSGLQAPATLPTYQQHINSKGKSPMGSKTVTPVNVPKTVPTHIVYDQSKGTVQSAVDKIEISKKKSSESPVDNEKLLPYYQQNIGEIPVRNRSLSPAPHKIMAPQLDPKPVSPLTIYKKDQQVKSKVKSIAANYINNKLSQSHITNVEPPILGYVPTPFAQKVDANKPKQLFKPDIVRKEIKETVKEMYSQQKHSMKKEETETHKTVSKMVQDSAGRPASPSTWRAKVETVQNLSPITIRLPSPRPDANRSHHSSSLSSHPPPHPTKGTHGTTGTTSAGGVGSGSACGPGSIGGSGLGGKGSIAGSTAPKRGRGVLNPNIGPGARIPLCGQCNRQIRGPFITALGKIWCPEHFVCVNAQCKRPLQDVGFVEESEGLYCEFCFEKFLAPSCNKCNSKIKGDCLNAIGKQFHPECFCCAYCNKMFGNNTFFLEDALPYCEADWNELFTTKCFSCGFPIEAGDRWVEALNNNYHSQCFNCSMCKKNLEGQSFIAKGGRPFCKNHAR